MPTTRHRRILFVCATSKLHGLRFFDTCITAPRVFEFGISHCHGMDVTCAGLGVGFLQSLRMDDRIAVVAIALVRGFWKLHGSELIF